MRHTLYPRGHQRRCRHRLGRLQLDVVQFNFITECLGSKDSGLGGQGTEGELFWLRLRELSPSFSLTALSLLAHLVLARLLLASFDLACPLLSAPTRHPTAQDHRPLGLARLVPLLAANLSPRRPRSQAVLAIERMEALGLEGREVLLAGPPAFSRGDFRH